MKMDNERAKLRPDTVTPDASSAPAGVSARAPRKRILLFLALAVALGYGGWKGYGWFVEGRFIVSTDDAYVKADQSIVAAKVPGLVAAVDVADNTQVKAGDTLVRVDDGDYRLAVEAARERIATQEATLARIVRQTTAQRASIEQAAAQLGAAQAELARANLSFARADSLARSGNGSVATLDQARADRDRAIANLAGARAGVEAANAALDVLRAQQAEAESQRRELETVLQRAERDLSFTAVRAPFDGIVGNRAAQPGQYVQPGTRLMAIVPLDGVYIQANFKETQLANLKPGQAVDVTVDAYPGRTIRGTLVSIAPASGSEFSLLPPENATGNFTKIVQRVPVRIAVPPEVAREGVLRPGMSVVAGVRTHDRPAAP